MQSNVEYLVERLTRRLLIDPDIQIFLGIIAASASFLHHSDQLILSSEDDSLHWCGRCGLDRAPFVFFSHPYFLVLIDFWKCVFVWGHQVPLTPFVLFSHFGDRLNWEIISFHPYFLEPLDFCKCVFSEGHQGRFVNSKDF